MFVVSVKAGKRKMLMALAALLLVLTVVLAAAKLHGAGVGASLPQGETNAQRVTFLQSYGWECGAEPLEFQDVTIPTTFDEVYQNYNQMQKGQGMDLLPYAGKTCRQWVYVVTNYPGYDEVRATILVLNGNIVGGDLSDPALNGFMCGFAARSAGDDGCVPDTASDAASAAPAQAGIIPESAWPTD